MVAFRKDTKTTCSIIVEFVTEDNAVYASFFPNMVVAADESQTHSQFIQETLASGRSALRVAALEALIRQAEAKYKADHGGSLEGVGSYAWHASVTQELEETKAGLEVGYHYPFLRGPERGKHLVLEDLPDGAGYRVDPNLDTISAVFSSLLQLDNLTVAPPKIVR